MHSLRELQDAATATVKKRRERVFWTDYEWKLLAKAILIEMLREPANVGKPIHQLANLAQERQKIFLHSENENNWTPRQFNGVLILTKAQKFLFEILSALKDDSQLLATASEESKQLKTELDALKIDSTAKIAELEKQVAALKNRKASWEDFTESEVIEQALLIQAERAERMERASSTIQKTFQEILEAVKLSKNETAEHINDVKSELQTAIDTALYGLPEKIQQLLPAPAPTPAAPLPVVKTPLIRVMNGNGKHHHKKTLKAHG